MNPCAPKYGTSINPYQNSNLNSFNNAYGNSAYGQQQTGYGQQAGYGQTGYGQQTGYGGQQNTNAYGNTNWGGTPNQGTSANTATNAFSNLFGQKLQTQANNLLGSSTTNNQGYFNNMQSNPWAQVFQGFVG
jgi:hypothetical protein